MPGLMSRPESRLLLAIFLAIGSISGAWFSELVLNYVPCKLCLWQRWPYYLAMPGMVLALIGLRARAAGRFLPAIALFLGVIFLFSAGLGLYHAGVEWKLWLGPADCGGRVTVNAPSLEDFHKALGRAKVVLCNEAPMRILGLSFAGWNAVVSLLVAALSFSAARGFARRG